MVDGIRLTILLVVTSSILFCTEVTGRIEKTPAFSDVDVIEVRAFGAGKRFGVKAGADGVYSLRGMEPGTYNVAVVVNGHPVAGPRLIRVTAGLPKIRLNFRVQSTGSLSGVVINGDLVPLRSVVVLAWQRSSQEAEGLVQRGVAITDQNGKFSITQLAPGKYFIESRPPAPERDLDGGEGPVRTFYPRSQEISGAAPVEVLEGGRTDGLRIVTLASTTHCLDIQARAREISAFDTVFMAVLEHDSQYPTQTKMLNPDALPSTRICGLSERRYKVRAVWLKQGTAVGMAFDEVLIKAETRNSVVLPFASACQVQVSVVLPERGIGESANAEPPELSLALKPIGRPFMQGEPLQHKLKAGTSRVENIFAGRYRAEVYGLSHPFRPYQLRSSSGDLLSDGSYVGCSETLELEVRADGSTISGEVVRDDGSGLPFARVFAVMVESGRSLPRSTTADQNGVFVLQGLPPGQYYVTSLKDIDSVPETEAIIRLAVDTEERSEVKGGGTLRLRLRAR